MGGVESEDGAQIHDLSDTHLYPLKPSLTIFNSTTTIVKILQDQKDSGMRCTDIR